MNWLGWWLDSDRQLPTTCGVVCVTLSHSNLCDREDIIITHLIIIIKSEVLTFPIAVIYFCCCVSEVVVSRESWTFCHLLLCSRMMCANNKVHYDSMVVFVCLHITLPHYHRYTDLSESIELLKCLSRTSCLSCVSKIKSIFSIIFHAIYGAVRIQLPISPMMVVRICVLYRIAIIKSEVGPIPIV